VLALVTVLSLALECYIAVVAAWGFAAGGTTLHRFLQLFCSNWEH